MMAFISTDIAYCPEAKAIVNYSASPDIFRDGATSITAGKGKIAPWGENNNLPFKVLDMIEKNEVVSSNLLFNIQSAYGLGLSL